MDGIPEVGDLQIRPAATGLKHSHRETDLNGTSTRSDQHLFGEEPASESENLNLKQSQCQSWIFFPIFSRSIRGYTLETNKMRQAVIRKLTAVIQGKKAELKMQTKQPQDPTELDCLGPLRTESHAKWHEKPHTPWGS